MREAAIAVAERYGEDGDRCVVACIDRRSAGVELRKTRSRCFGSQRCVGTWCRAKENCSYLPKNLPYGEEASCPQEAISRYCTVRFSTMLQASSDDLAQQPADSPGFTVERIRREHRQRRNEWPCSNIIHVLAAEPGQVGYPSRCFQRRSRNRVSIPNNIPPR
jgi:hypothetical protein